MSTPMKASIDTGHRQLAFDLARPFPISIRLRAGAQNPVAWYAEYPRIAPVRMEGFVGSVAEGGSVNTNDISFNPHGNGTHTECIGHLTEENQQIDEYLREYHFVAQVITADLQTLDSNESEYRRAGDRLLSMEAVQGLKLSPDVRAIILRTSPNDDTKLTRSYTGQNPPYLDPPLCDWLRRQGIDHLLLDLPSVDRESDGGKMLAHRAFWYEEGRPRMHATITEMVYVPDSIPDGEYLLNLMVAPFGNDASPSKPVLYPILP